MVEKDFFFPFFLEIFKTEFAFHLAEQQKQQQQKKPCGHFSLLRESLQMPV